jgi:pimeloyl-ACP methyl ester carboxylesterase
MPAGYRLRCPDRGYWGQQTALGESGGGSIVVAHSLGLHLLQPKVIAAAELVVLLGAFRSFHPEGQHAARRSRRAVERMLARLDCEPKALLGDFYERCFAPAESAMEVPGIPNVRLLRTDLELLQASVLDLTGLRKAARVLLLHGCQDRIAPLERAEQLHRLLPNSALCTFEGAGHALPLTHGRQSWGAIERTWRRMHP